MSVERAVADAAPRTHLPVGFPPETLPQLAELASSAFCGVPFALGSSLQGDSLFREEVDLLPHPPAVTASDGLSSSPQQRSPLRGGEEPAAR